MRAWIGTAAAGKAMNLAMNLAMSAPIVFALASAGAAQTPEATTPAQQTPASEAPAENAETPDATAPVMQGGATQADFPPLGPAERHVTEQEWRAYAAGRTLYYATPSGIMGREYYYPEGNRVVFIYYDGRCYDGAWAVRGTVFCFDYDGLHCFNHIARDGKMYARETDGDEQEVLRRTEEVLSCQPELLSFSPAAAPAEAGG